jgi:hypothetical protein
VPSRCDDQRVAEADLDGIRYLRTLADCNVLRGDLQTSGKVMVV